MLQGFRTVIINLIAILAIWLNDKFGIQLNEELQTSLAVTILGLVNICLRFITKTPIFKKDENNKSNYTKHFILIPLVLVGLIGCTIFKAETPAQRYYALKSEYERLLIVAVGYKENCLNGNLPDNCKNHVKYIRKTDNSIYQAFDDADYLVQTGASEDLALAIVPISTGIQEFANYLSNLNQE
jgi:hypothetical protein